MFWVIYFNIFHFLITNYTNLLSLGLLNKLGFFPKLAKNCIIFIVFDILVFRINHTISKISI